MAATNGYMLLLRDCEKLLLESGEIDLGVIVLLLILRRCCTWPFLSFGLSTCVRPYKVDDGDTEWNGCLHSITFHLLLPYSRNASSHRHSLSNLGSECVGICRCRVRFNLIGRSNFLIGIDSVGKSLKPPVDVKVMDRWPEILGNSTVSLLCH